MVSVCTPFGVEFDQSIMQRALVLARNAAEQDEVPIGALVVDSTGAVVGQGVNMSVQRSFQGAHAECVAIEQAGKLRGDWRLEDCWLYVTLQPCAMCYYLAVLSRMRGIVYGASSPLYGYVIDVYSPDSIYHKHKPAIIAGVLADESAILLKKFFITQRDVS